MRFIFFTLCVLQISGFELYIPPLPIPEDLRSELSIVMDGDRNMIAVWLENGVVYVSDLPQEGAWTIPSPLSSILKKSASPRMAIEASGKTTVIWIEENSIKSATRSEGKDWSLFTLEPSILETSPSKDKSKSRLSVSLSPLSEVEPAEGALATLQVTRGKASEGLGLELKGSKDLEDFDPALLPMANAIDAPTSTILSGAQIGFAAGTAAPANGLVVSGATGIGTSSISTGRFCIVAPTVTASSNLGIGLLVSSAGTYTYSANSDVMEMMRISGGTLATTTGSLTTLAYRNLYLSPTPAAVTGDGTIATAIGLEIGQLNMTATNKYGLYVNKPAGTGNNYTAYFDTIVGIGTAPNSNTILRIAGNNTQAANNYGIALFPTIGSSSGTIAESAAFYVSSLFASNAGTVTAGYGILVDTGSAGGTITTGYGLKIAALGYGTTRYGLHVTQPSGGTNNYTAYFDPVIGVNTASPDTGSMLNLGGIFTNVNGGYQEGILLSATLNPTGGAAGDVRAFSSQPTIIAPTATTINRAMAVFVYNYLGSNIGTISNAYGIYVDVSYTAGTVTNNYGLYVNRPNGGTNRYTAYFDVGVGIGAAPASDRVCIVSGDIRNVVSNYGLVVQPTLGATSGTVTQVMGLYLSANIASNVGTVSNLYGLYIDTNGTPAGTITTAYGLYVAKPSAGTNKYTAYFDNNIGIGNVPTSYIGLWNGGGVTSTSANAVQGFRNSPTLGCTSGTMSSCYSMYNYADFSLNSATITSAYGLYIDVGNTAGTITNGYGLYVTNPAYGTNQYTAYFDPVVSVGQTPFVNVSLNNGGTLTGTSGDLHATRTAVSLGASSGTVTNSWQLSVNPQHSDNAGTISFAYGLQVLAGSTAGTITNGFNLYVSNPAYGTNKYCAVFDGLVIPGGNKANNLGATGSRWNTIYYVTATTGTSRLANSRTMCGYCNQVMKRGTGTTYTLGEDADYIPVFCTECGAQKVEKIQHLPRARLLERLPAPKIEFLGFKVSQYSGHSRGIQVLYRYVDKEKDDPMSGKENSTYLSESEYEQFLSLTESGQRAYLKELGQREWDAMEEVRLMKEECSSLQEQLNVIGNKWVGKDLLTEEL